VLAVAAGVTALILSASFPAQASASTGDKVPPGHSGVVITTLSTRPDRVSGGNVLTQVAIADQGDRPRISLNGRDITSTFHRGTSAGSYVGLVTDLNLGRNTLVAEARGKTHGSSRATLTVTNYPLAGPITSGPHIEPFVCQTQSFRLPDGTFLTDAPVTNAGCAAPTKVTYVYLKEGATTLVPLPTGPLPSDVAMTTTTTGKTVRFIVRVETGTIDRGIYQSAILHDPTVDPAPSPFTPPAGWNHRLIAVEGAGCPGGWYIQGAVTGSSPATADRDFDLFSVNHLGQGYATFTNTLQHPSNNCNAVVSGEAAMMSKEHFIETYGAPKYTVSAGCSGGSYGSIQLADAMPGLFDGALIECTFPDPLSIANSASDSRLLAHYFQATNPTGFTKEQQVAISGYKFSGSDGTLAWIDSARQSGRTDPVPGRVEPAIPNYTSAPVNSAVPRSLLYDPVTNPTGARADLYDANRNVYGVDPDTGFALRTFDNTGVQYGLAQLNSGAITVDQFLDLNTGIGGIDQDANYTAARAVGDTGAIRRAYQSGLEFSGSGGMSSIPLMDLTGIYNDDSGYHYQWTHFAARERIAEANGNADTEVMWRGNVPFAQAWDTFIAWVEATVADKSTASGHDKVVRNKPAAAVDGCWADRSQFINERQVFGSAPSTTCNRLFPSYAFPRYEAGSSVAADNLKCQLKPVNVHDYQASFTPAQAKRLSEVFRSGVCDFTRPGVSQSRIVPWASFGPAPQNLVFNVTDPHSHR
jgi:hypothetical protein